MGFELILSMSYKTFKISDGISLIQETHVANFMRCNIWHIKGQEFDLIIDTGMGLSSLKEYILEKTSKPIKAIVTHSHFDHCGSLHEFNCRLGHKNEEEIFKNTLNDKIVFSGAWKEIEIIDKKQFPEYSGEKYTVTPAPLTGYLDEGDVIDLGSRAFNILHLPGHSPGSIGLLDLKSKELFSGDALYDGELLDNLYHSDPKLYEKTLSRIIKLDVNIFHGGHFPSFGKNRAKEIINNYFSGQNKIKDVKLWFNKSKGMSKDIFSDQNWDSSIKLISQNEI
jgi:glyoxylase-like metal-dependent hydrolase (beta-lactamase superfamily II)